MVCRNISNIYPSNSVDNPYQPNCIVSMRQWISTCQHILHRMFPKSYLSLQGEVMVASHFSWQLKVRNIILFLKYRLGGCSPTSKTATNTVNLARLWGSPPHQTVWTASSGDEKGIPTKWCVLPVCWNTVPVKHAGSVGISLSVSLTTMLIFGCGMTSSGQTIALFIAAVKLTGRKI